MRNTEAAIKKEPGNGFIAENQKGINNHKETVIHLEPGAKHHDGGNNVKSDQHMKQAIIAIYERILEDKFFEYHGSTVTQANVGVKR